MSTGRCKRQSSCGALPRAAAVRRLRSSLTRTTHACRFCGLPQAKFKFLALAPGLALSAPGRLPGLKSAYAALLLLAQLSGRVVVWPPLSCDSSLVSKGPRCVMGLCSRWARFAIRGSELHSDAQCLPMHTGEALAFATDHPLCTH